MGLQYKKSQRLFLWAVAIHSLLVGLGLILATNEIRILFGFKPSGENFFQTQGGVFHIVMASAYAMAAYDPKKFESLIFLTFLVKLFASIFLFLYYIIGSQNWLIFVSGVIDLFICLIVFTFIGKAGIISFLKRER